ncbi:VOC family protein [Altererythrobacter sp. FM1]|uniref:VOC family protein n=1 Tax=Tsuneonella flava TaxID=2055955 RepID=A0ABX7K9A2_9SPHN|nr:VOC family protein [Tsuneonella flava]QSB44843.1 VOC family protein [Tsuneonella flava]ROT96564.1 VOC family protein [Altererythrobacter sp. FM1]
MFSHVMLGADDFDAAKKFYDATLGVLGAREGSIDPKGRLIYIHNGAAFLITKPIDGQPASCGNGSTIGFAMESPEQAKAWHDAGVAAGGTSIEDEPGERPGSGMYLAYLRDPSGNKLCGLHRLG